MGLLIFLFVVGFIWIIFVLSSKNSSPKSRPSNTRYHLSSSDSGWYGDFGGYHSSSHDLGGGGCDSGGFDGGGCDGGGGE
ncbi:MAG: hypothetical protein ACHBN1_19030 [Heteroscytonema crispum UTEX LB 1556]